MPPPDVTDLRERLGEEDRPDPQESYFLVGVGGSGMAPLARLLRAGGHRVAGSDRALDQGQIRERFERLRQRGIDLWPQDGSGPRPGDRLVLSTAIEEDNPDLVRARQLVLVVEHRSEVLARLFGRKRGVAVSGTSGKSTTTALLAHICQRLGLRPSVLLGADVFGLDEGRPAACLAGSGELFLIEADESDGSLVRYEPEIGVVTNVSKDHMPVPELLALFRQFAGRCRGAVVLGADCPRAASLAPAAKRVHQFGLSAGHTRAEALQTEPNGSRFTVAGQAFRLPIPGLHNVQNALAAIAVCRELGLDLAGVAEGLSSFPGLSRRLELVGRARGVEVYDDYAHNPDKLAAVLAATAGPRRFLLFQPHGYGPTRFLLRELAAALAAGTSENDRLLLLPIYDAGGTASRSISSADLAQAIAEEGGRAQVAAARSEAGGLIAAEAAAGDLVLVLGARDPTLPALARQIVRALESGG